MWVGSYSWSGIGMCVWVGGCVGGYTVYGYSGGVWEVELGAGVHWMECWLGERMQVEWKVD